MITRGSAAPAHPRPYTHLRIRFDMSYAHVNQYHFITRKGPTKKIPHSHIWRLFEYRIDINTSTLI